MMSAHDPRPFEETIPQLRALLDGVPDRWEVEPDSRGKWSAFPNGIPFALITEGIGGDRQMVEVAAVSRNVLEPLLALVTATTYYTDRLERVHRREVVRDLPEARAGYETAVAAVARALSDAMSTKEPR